MPSPPLLLLLLLLTLHSCSASPSPPPVPDGEALMAFKSAADTRNLLLFNRSSLHCLWPGIRCSPSGRVVRLVLESSSLAGTLPATALSDLDQLRILSLKSNALSGPIPDLSGLLNLKSLFLSYNLLSGPFPPSLLALRRLHTLDLSHNRLSGSIPAPLPTSLDRLYSLDLSNNQFNGTVPSFNQSTLKSLNLSNNNLTGAIPVTFVLSTFPISVFSGNPGLCGEAVRRECRSHFQFFRPPGSIAPAPGAAAAAASGGGSSSRGDPALLASQPSERRRRGITAIAFLAAGFLLILLVGVMLAVRKRRRMGRGKRLTPENDAGIGGSNEIFSEHNVVDVESGGNELAAAATAIMMSEEKVKRLGKSGCLMFCAGEAPVYTLEQLMRASAEMLGRGSVGSTYKAVLDNRLIVSVKRLDAAKLGMTGKEAFERHMDAVGRLRHPNLVPLRAYFQAKEERLLVYDYQPNGSLYSLIHGSKSTRAKPLHWTSCLKIAEDVAQGLAYIHQASRLVHGNIKSSNVLLGPDFEACLTDNCLSFLVEPLDSEDDSVYRAPETQKSNTKLTPKSDIYAFGVLLLELLTGSQHPVVSWTDLPAWVRSVRDDEGADDERLTMIIDIAAACVRSSAESRPTTWQLLKMIQEVKDADMGNNDDSACIA